MKRRAVLAASAALTGLGVRAQTRTPADELRVAIISPTTGVLSDFGTSNTYAHQLLAPRLAAGLATQHMGQRRVRLELHDAASSSAKAAAIASALAAEGVHLVLASGTPEICNPVADVCEAAGVPCVTTVAPWQAWFFGRKGHPEKGFRWTYHFFIGLEDFADVYTSLFQRAGLGSNVGVLWPDDIDGAAFQGAFAQAMASRHLHLIDPGRLRLAAPDYTAAATALRAAKAEIVTGVLPAPMALEFLKVAQQVGYHPRMASFAKAFPFPDTVARASQPGMVLTNEVWWSPAWPFRSGLTGASAEQVARGYESATGKPWMQTLGFSHALIDVAAQAVQQAASPTRQGLRDALSRLRAKTVVGPLSFVGRNPSLNVCSTPAVGGQWLQDKQGRWVLEVVDNTRSPFIPVTAKLKPGTA